jgi:hypothetical protein
LLCLSITVMHCLFFLLWKHGNNQHACKSKYNKGLYVEPRDFVRETSELCINNEELTIIWMSSQ